MEKVCWQLTEIGSESENFLSASNALSVALRYVPSILYVPVFNEFYSPVSRVPITGGLEVWRGYHQSVRVLMAGHLGINVDIASTVMRKGGITLIDYILEVKKLRSPNDIGRIPASDLNKLLKSINVCTTHRGDQKQRFKIARVGKDTSNSLKFEYKASKDDPSPGETISIAKYYQKVYNLRLQYPDLPLVLKANGKTAFPIEVLSIVPAQRFRARLSGDQTADQIKATCIKPADRCKQIEDGVRETLRYGDNSYLKSFGMEISTEMLKVKARVLPSPKVVFKNNQSLDGREGQWNLRGKQLVNTPELKSCAFLFFVNTKDGESIRSAIISKWYCIHLHRRTAGMNITASNPPVCVINPNSDQNIRGGIQTAFKQAQQKFKFRPQLLVCVIDQNMNWLYEKIKNVCLCDAGVASQVMLSKNVMYEIKDQYIANVALKANIKIGGASNYVDRNLTDKSTMFVGIGMLNF